MDECHAERIDTHHFAVHAVFGAGVEESRSVMEKAVQELEQRSEDYAWTIYSGTLGLVSLLYRWRWNRGRDLCDIVSAFAHKVSGPTMKGP